MGTEVLKPAAIQPSFQGYLSDSTAVQNISRSELHKDLLLLQGMYGKLTVFLTEVSNERTLVEDIARLYKTNVEERRGYLHVHFDDKDLENLKIKSNKLSNLLEAALKDKKNQEEEAKLSAAVGLLKKMISEIDLVKNTRQAQITAEYLKENSALKLFKKDADGYYQVITVPDNKQQEIAQNLQQRNHQSFRVWTSSVSGNETLIAAENEPACIEAMANYLIEKCKQDPTKTVFIKEGKPNEKEIVLKLCARAGVIVKSCGGQGGWPSPSLKALHEALAHFKNVERIDISDWAAVLRRFMENSKPIKKPGFIETYLPAIAPITDIITDIVTPIDLFKTYLSCFQPNDEVVMRVLNLSIANIGSEKAADIKTAQLNAMKIFRALDGDESTNFLSQHAVFKKLIELDPDGNNAEVALKRHDLYASCMLDKENFTGNLNSLFKQVCKIRHKLESKKTTEKAFGDKPVDFSTEEEIAKDESKELIKALIKYPDFLSTFMRSYPQAGPLRKLVMSNATVEDLQKLVDNIPNIKSGEKAGTLQGLLKSFGDVKETVLFGFLENSKPDVRIMVMTYLSKDLRNKIIAKELELAKTVLLGMVKKPLDHKSAIIELFSESNSENAISLLIGYPSPKKPKIRLSDIIKSCKDPEISEIFNGILAVSKNADNKLDQALFNTCVGNFFQCVDVNPETRNEFGKSWQSLKTNGLIKELREIETCFSLTPKLFEVVKLQEIEAAKDTFIRLLETSSEGTSKQTILRQFLLKVPSVYLEGASFKAITYLDVMPKLPPSKIYLIHNEIVQLKEAERILLTSKFIRALDSCPQFDLKTFWQGLSVETRRTYESFLTDSQKTTLRDVEVTFVRTAFIKLLEIGIFYGNRIKQASKESKIPMPLIQRMKSEIVTKLTQYLSNDPKAYSKDTSFKTINAKDIIKSMDKHSISNLRYFIFDFVHGLRKSERAEIVPQLFVALGDANGECKNVWKDFLNDYVANINILEAITELDEPTQARILPDVFTALDSVEGAFAHLWQHLDLDEKKKYAPYLSSNQIEFLTQQFKEKIPSYNPRINEAGVHVGNNFLLEFEDDLEKRFAILKAKTRRDDPPIAIEQEEKAPMINGDSLDASSIKEYFALVEGNPQFIKGLMAKLTPDRILYLSNKIEAMPHNDKIFILPDLYRNIPDQKLPEILDKIPREHTFKKNLEEYCRIHISESNLESNKEGDVSDPEETGSPQLGSPTQHRS